MPCANHADVTAGLAACSRCERTFCPDCLVELQGFAYCAPCKREQVRDIHSGADSRHVELATLERRLSAFLLDSALLATPLCAGLLAWPGFFDRATGAPDKLAMALVAAGSSCLWAAYEALLLARWGQTLGKRALGIKVVTAEGQDVRSGQAWGRALVRALAGAVFIDYLPAFVTRERTCIHDVLARTRVIRWRA